MDDFDQTWEEGMTMNMGGLTGTVDQMLDVFTTGGGYSAVQDVNWADYGVSVPKEDYPFGGANLDVGAADGANPADGGPVAQPSKFSGLLGTVNKVGEWAEKNKTLANILAQGVGGAASAYQAKQPAKDQAAQRQRIADSITALKPRTVGQPTPLTRMNGQQVFNSQGRIAR
jgi:hypothetical protein